MSTTTTEGAAKRGWPGYNAIWRWHFYAGLFCIPFILWLPITGSIYLFKPQIEAWLERPYEQLQVTGARASAETQVEAALAAMPGSVLNSYELPATPHSAVRVLVGHGTDLFRIYVHPETLQILKQESEDGRLMNLLFYLHGEFLLGTPGSMLVELAASWTIMLFITGLYLWWPRNTQGLAGIVYPRLGRGGRIFWRDLHSVTGLWISFFTLFLLISGLPWATSWGGMLQELREIGASTVVKQDWSTGQASDLERRQAMNTPASAVSGHAGHQLDEQYAGKAVAGYDYSGLDRMIATVQALHLAPPVLIAPPSKDAPAWVPVSKTDWTARSESQNRPLRVNLVLDERTGAIKSREDFADRPLLDRIIGIGVAAHEGQLFGWPNQALGLFTAMGLMLMTVSSIVMWWRRRSPGTLGAPKATRVLPRFSIVLIVIIVFLGLILPLLGISILVVAIIERWILQSFPATREFLGLNCASSTDLPA